jgi:hypothetical protein
MPPNHRCSVKLIGPRCEHDLCVEINRGVPPELRCEAGQPDGYGHGGGSACGCQLPHHMVDMVERELRDNLQESKRRGFVIIEAA